MLCLCTASPAAGNILSLVQPAKEYGRQAGAVVRHGAEAASILFIHGKEDLTALGIVGHAVLNQVVQHPQKKAGVAGKMDGASRMNFGECELILPGQAVVQHFADGLSSDFHQVGKIYKANTWQTLRHIVFPAAMPTILAGIKIAISSGWMVVVAAEMLASKSGLGFLINRGHDSYDVALIMVAMILIGVVGALLSAVFTLIERKMCGWMSKE